jgi:DNA-nicking Smr family endonuclease
VPSTRAWLKYSCLVKKRDGDDRTSDADRFAREMLDVVPLKPDPRGRNRAHGRNRAFQPIAAQPSSTDAVDAPDDDFAAHGVDRREIRKLKRGQYPVEGRRDLHGMTAAEARTSVGRFIDNSRHRHLRCVCIVHGRGLHSEGKVSVLKTRVRESLRSHPSVLAYADAPSSDGGTGAVYVLLRR